MLLTVFPYLWKLHHTLGAERIFNEREPRNLELWLGKKSKIPSLVATRRKLLERHRTHGHEAVLIIDVAIDAFAADLTTDKQDMDTKQEQCIFQQHLMSSDSQSAANLDQRNPERSHIFTRPQKSSL